MSIVSFGPQWFLGFDSLFEFLTMIIVFCIGYYSLKVFRLSKESKYFYLSFSFFAIALAYLAEALSNILIYVESSQKELLVERMQEIIFLHQAGLIAHIALILIAYVTLVALALKIRDKRVLSLLVILVVLATILGSSYFLLFHLVSVVLLLYVVPYFYARYRASQSHYTRGILISFLLITFSHVSFVLLLTGHQWWYVVGEVAQLFGYVGLLMNLIWCLRNG